MEILEAREQRKAHVLAFGEPGCTTLCLKANLPTGWKQGWQANLVLKAFRLEIERWQPQKTAFYRSADGDYYLFALKESAEACKRKCMQLEETHPLGRLADLDVYREGQSVSRTEFGGTLRKCMLCDLPAAVCVRNRTHAAEEVMRFAEKKLRDYYQPLIERAVSNAVQGELHLPHKFGLVESNSDGSHRDMNLASMERSAKAVLPFWMQMFWQGVKAPFPQAFEACRTLGLLAEEAMYAASGGVNTYKGLIFQLGCLLYSFGHLTGENLPWEELFQGVSLATANSVQPKGTFGEKAKQCGFCTALEQAQRGLPAVQETWRYLQNHGRDEASLRGALQCALSVTDDTVLLKRAGNLSSYEAWKRRICACTPQEAPSLTKECVRHNISIGGAADVLVGALAVDAFAAIDRGESLPSFRRPDWRTAAGMTKLRMLRLSEDCDDDALEYGEFDVRDFLPEKAQAFREKYKEFYDDVKLSHKEDW